MNAARLVRRMMQRYGADATVEYGNRIIKVKAYIQPMRYKNKMFLDSQITSIGTVDESCFLYIGPPDVYLTEGTTDCIVTCNSVEYMVVKTETVTVFGQKVYNWAILRNLRQE